MLKVNLNDQVLLTLTPQGIDAYKKWVDRNLPLPLRGGPYHSLKGEVLDTSLHELMNSLGDYFFNGAPQIVVDNKLTFIKRSYGLTHSPPAGFYEANWKRDEDLVERSKKVLNSLNLVGFHCCPSESVEVFYEDGVCMLRDLRGCVHIYQDISERILSLESFGDIAKRCNPPQEKE